MTDSADKVAKQAHIFARDEFDWYVEEQRASEGLFEVERFIGDIYDPACGSGNIIKAARAAGYGAYGSDIVRRTAEDWFTREIDFLDTQIMAGAGPNIVCNPPFYRGAGTENFIRKALEFSCGKVAIFCSIGFLAGAKRAAGIFADHPPHRIWVVTPRVSCPPGEWLAAGNKAGGGTDDWVWLVWDQTAPKPALSQLGWIRKSKESA